MDRNEQYKRMKRGGLRPAPFALAAPQRQLISYNRATVGYPETKYFDCGFNAAMTGDGTTWANTEVPMDNFIDTSGTVSAYTDSCLLPTATGSGYGQIIGSKFWLRKVRVKGALRIDTISVEATAPEPSFIRLMLVLDKQPNKAQAQGEEVMQDYGTRENNVHSYMNVIGNIGRFEILQDKNYALRVDESFNDSATTGTIGFNGINFKLKWIPRNPVQVSIVSGFAVPSVSQTITHNVFMLCLGVRDAGAAGIKLDGCTRCYFTE